MAPDTAAPSGDFYEAVERALDESGHRPAPAAQRYPWRVRCSGCGWVDHFDTQENAQAWADRHNAQPTWPHDAKVGPRD